MQYRKDKKSEDISILGYGCMRFSQIAGKIDMKKAESEIMTAFNQGINYYDTAYIYPGSEAALGEILAKNQIREKVKIATKLPHYMIKSRADMDKYFDEQLRRLKTDYIDYYLMHMLTDIQTWERLISLGILEWLEEKRKAGTIKQIGFSYHGNSDMFCQLLDAYNWDFTQIQYNYLDVHSQAGSTGLHYAAKKNVPVIIMEPLRGGRLAKDLPAAAVKKINDYDKKRSPAEWAFRWLWNQSEVTCVLSGMNSLDMINENIRVANEVQIGEFTPEDDKLLEDVVKAINVNQKVGCTGCRYCMPCPKNVDIPGTFAAYNRKASDGWFSAIKDYFMCTGLRKNYTGPANCIGCGLCEKHCPQHIDIRNELKNAKKELEGPVYKIARKVVPLVMKY